MKKQIKSIELKDGKIAKYMWTEWENRPTEYWSISIDEKIQLSIMQYDGECWKHHPRLFEYVKASDQPDFVDIRNDLLEKRNSFPNRFSVIETKPEAPPLKTIKLGINLIIARTKTGTLTILPNDKYPLEIWSITENKNLDDHPPITIDELALYYEEGKWSVWTSGVTKIAQELEEKRNTLNPSGTEATLNLALDRIQKTP
jgi:hypothetical protein